MDLDLVDFYEVDFICLLTSRKTEPKEPNRPTNGGKRWTKSRKMD